MNPLSRNMFIPPFRFDSAGSWYGWFGAPFCQRRFARPPRALRLSSTRNASLGLSINLRPYLGYTFLSLQARMNAALILPGA
jgi:hypothetical protein